MGKKGKYQVFKLSVNSKGFTIIEIISVLIIIGVLSAVTLSKMDSTDIYDVVKEIEILKTHLRYSQIRAMNHNESWGIHISDGTSYTLQKNGSIAPVNLPNKDSATHAFAKGIKTDPGTQVIRFDELGSPGKSDIIITFKKQGKNPRKITITRKTGFIH